MEIAFIEYMLRNFRTFVVGLSAGLVSSLAAADPAPFGTRVAMDQRSSGNVYVTGYFDQSVATEFLVDTGSGYVTVSKATFREISKQPGTEYLRTIRGALANGNVIKLPIYRVARFSIGTQCDLVDVEVAVMPGKSANILGINALQQKQPFALQFDPPQLLLTNCGVPSESSAAATVSAL